LIRKLKVRVISEITGTKTTITGPEIDEVIVTGSPAEFSMLVCAPSGMIVIESSSGQYAESFVKVVKRMY
jgi:hypothetical protein